jgi:tetratricopeptide (TPR) repeat protein
LLQRTCHIMPSLPLLTLVLLIVAAVSGCAPEPRHPLSPAEKQASRLNTRATHAFEREAPDAALRLADRARQAAPDSGWGHYNRAHALAALGYTDEALHAFERAQVLLAEDHWGRSVVLYGIAHTLREAGRCRRAATAHRQYTAFAQRHGSPYPTGRAEAFLAACVPAAADWDLLATPAGRRATQASTASARALAEGDFEQALQMAERAAHFEPRYGWAHYNRAAALAGLGRAEEAFVAYQQAVALLPDLPWGRSVALYGYAHAMNSEGRCDEALAIYRAYARFMKHLGDSQDVADARTALRVAAACETP